MSEEIQAAGGLVVRDGALLVVHRPRYSDWSLPKGKLDPGETWEEAAVREVWEEAGVRCRLARELPPVTYEHKGRPKRVRYWLMEPAEEEPPFEANDEVDEVRWVSPAEALELLSYERDRALVRSAGL